MSFTKDNEAYLRSLGYSGTRFDSPRDRDLVEKNKFLYDSIVKAAGDDGELTQAEYESIYSLPDRGPWGKYAYNDASVQDALARAAQDTGFRINQNTLDRHDLAYDGDDIMSKVYQGDYGPDMKDKDKYTWERSIEEDDDDAWNVFRYKANKIDPVEEEEEEEKPIKPIDPTPECPAGQVKGVSGTCIEDKPYAENPWEEPKKIPKNLKDKRDDWDTNWDPSRRVNDFSDLGSIPFVTELMNARGLEKDYETNFLDTFMKSKGMKGDY